jgi:hypothetical protein
MSRPPLRLVSTAPHTRDEGPPEGVEAVDGGFVIQVDDRASKWSVLMGVVLMALGAIAVGAGSWDLTGPVALVGGTLAFVAGIVVLGHPPRTEPQYIVIDGMGAHLPGGYHLTWWDILEAQVRPDPEHARDILIYRRRGPAVTTGENLDGEVLRWLATLLTAEARERDARRLASA